MRGERDSVASYMPWWLGDYRADTGDLDCLEHGAYLQLLGELWTAGGYLPFEPSRLCLRINLKLRQWDAVWSTISRFFTVDQDNRMSQRRLLYELERAREMRTKRSAAGHAGADARYGKRSSNAMANAVANGCHPSPSPDPEEDQIPPKAPPRGAVVARASAKVKPIAPPDYPDGFERIWAGCDRMGTKADAFKAWRQVGEPAPEVVIASWAGWKRVAWPDGIGVQHVATWLREFNFREQPAPSIRGKQAPKPAPPPEPNGLALYCDWHKAILNTGKPSKRPAPTCPECKHMSARAQDRASGGPVAIGALDDPMPGWGR